MLNTGNISNREKFSLLYHHIFEYPLSLADLIKWLPSDKFESKKVDFSYKNNFYFIKGNDGLVYKRLLRKRTSAKKMKIAKRVASFLSLFPSIKMVGVTGSLAMENSSSESDIDLIIITKKGLLWTTRLVVLVALMKQIRRFGDKNQKDKLCMNIWLDESDIFWKKKDQNLYTAHEIAQIIPLVNKDKTYEKFIWKNIWIKNFWPNAVKLPYGISHKLYAEKPIKHKACSIILIIERFTYWIQYRYMKSKISRETITPTRALFHPKDWGKNVLNHFSNINIHPH
jgi:D-beta-D-heptose 7-phosphate kinase/D-beta-D-heptose 1-phosphate adenosyltransferase